MSIAVGSSSSPARPTRCHSRRSGSGPWRLVEQATRLARRAGVRDSEDSCAGDPGGDDASGTSSDGGPESQAAAPG